MRRKSGFEANGGGAEGVDFTRSKAAADVEAADDEEDETAEKLEMEGLTEDK